MEWTTGAIIAVVSLGFNVVSAVVGVTVYIVVVKVKLDNMESLMKETKTDLDTHRNNEDKHHNKADFVRFEQGINEKFKSFEKGFDDVKSEMRSQFTTLIELVTNKPTRTRNTNK